MGSQEVKPDKSGQPAAPAAPAAPQGGNGGWIGALVMGLGTLVVSGLTGGGLSAVFELPTLLLAAVLGGIGFLGGPLVEQMISHNGAPAAAPSTGGNAPGQAQSVQPQPGQTQATPPQPAQPPKDAATQITDGALDGTKNVVNGAAQWANGNSSPNDGTNPAPISDNRGQIVATGVGGLAAWEAIARTKEGVSGALGNPIKVIKPSDAVGLTTKLVPDLTPQRAIPVVGQNKNLITAGRFAKVWTPAEVDSAIEAQVKAAGISGYRADHLRNTLKWFSEQAPNTKEFDIYRRIMSGDGTVAAVLKDVAANYDNTSAAFTALPPAQQTSYLRDQLVTKTEALATQKGAAGTAEALRSRTQIVASSPDAQAWETAKNALQNVTPDEIAAARTAAKAADWAQKVTQAQAAAQAAQTGGTALAPEMALILKQAETLSNLEILGNVAKSVQAIQGSGVAMGLIKGLGKIAPWVTAAISTVEVGGDVMNKDGHAAATHFGEGAATLASAPVALEVGTAAGAGATLLTSMAVGAIAGSEVPIVGNIVGGLVGLGVGALTMWGFGKAGGAVSNAVAGDAVNHALNPGKQTMTAANLGEFSPGATPPKPIAQNNGKPVPGQAAQNQV